MAPPDLDALRTRVANQAASLAETVTDGFDGYHLGGGDWTVELMPPEGNSTRGGAQARQPIRLVPRRPGYPAIVVGTVDPVYSLAEIRTFEHVSILHELRFKRPIPITIAEYMDFLAKLQVVLTLARVKNVPVPPHPDLVAQHSAARNARISRLGLVVLAVVLVLAGLVAYRAYRARAPGATGENATRPAPVIG